MIETQKLLEGLTDAQREAVTHADGPLLIIAAAGSGKTRVITRRVAHLISLGIPAPSILAITFTNKAAGEMKSRVSVVCGRQMRDFGRLDQVWPTICTFHSLCLRVLRHYAPMIELPQNFSIYDSADQTKLIKEALKSLDISSTNFSPGQVHATISNAKNQLQSAEAFSQAAGDFYQRTIARAYTKYQQLLSQNNALDFDDLLMRTAHAMRDHSRMLRELQDRFQYIHIDEYQDTNHAQYVIAHALALRHRNICVVGDPDQSIYAWRGADIKNILEFERDYPDAKVVKLEQNYRSTKVILDIAAKLITNNTRRKDKQLWTENAQGERAKLFLAQDEHDEARVITSELKKLHEEQAVDWNQVAIFYRMNALSRVMEDELRHANVPYQIARGVEFYNRKEIKDVLAYLRVIVNPNDEVSLDRIVNVPPRGIGDSSVKLMQAWAIGHSTGLWDAMQNAGHIQGLSTRAVKSTQQFLEVVKSWRNLTPSPRNRGEGSGERPATSEQQTSIDSGSTAPLSPALSREYQGDGVSAHTVQRIMENVVQGSGLEALLKKSADPDLPELENVNELITSAAEYDREHPEGSLQDYLALVSLVSDADHLKDAGGAVTLMTLHAAKGLEFPVVAMIGMEEGVLPHSRSRGNIEEMEEERRLCFVGITRAQERLLLSKAAYRTIRGLRERTVTSPFLGEMPPEAMEVFDRTGLESDNRLEYRERLRDESSRLASQFQRGQLVRHPTFGLGRITDVSDMGQQTRAIIDFNQAGRKTLILQYARLEAVS